MSGCRTRTVSSCTTIRRRSLLRHPNPVTTRYRHMFATVADIAIYDRAYWRILRQQDRLAVVRISPEILHAYDETSPNGTLRRVYRLNDGTVIPRQQLIIFPGYSPDNFDEGVSPLETLRRVLEEEAGAIAHRQGMWRNAARQSGLDRTAVGRPGVVADGAATVPQRDRGDDVGCRQLWADRGARGRDALERGFVLAGGHRVHRRAPSHLRGDRRRLRDRSVAVRVGVGHQVVDRAETHRGVSGRARPVATRDSGRAGSATVAPVPTGHVGLVVFRVQHRREVEGFVRSAGDGVDDGGRCAGDDTERGSCPPEPATHRGRLASTRRSCR